jgi:hypothetical protein
VFQQDNTTIKERLTRQKRRSPVTIIQSFTTIFYFICFLKKGESSAIIQSFTSFVQKESGIKLETS